MSIETLLEAAKFLELQAQQQQKAREENELRERLHLEQLADRRPSKAHYTSSSLGVLVSHAGRPGEPQPAPPQPPLPPLCVPITVVPIPIVTTNHSGLPSPPAPAPQLPPEPLLPQPKTERMSPNHKLQGHAPHPHIPQITSQPANANKLQPPSPQQLLQCYPGSVVPGPQQHPLFPQTGPPPPPQVLLQHSPISRGSPPDDSPHLDNKKRPGGAGTRDVHNKLEKNRRAHLKECFEMLKKNIPNVDEKKTSNLSVLRSALRYIQTLKRKEKEYEHEMERLAREKIATQQRLADLKNDLSQWMDVMEMERVLRQTVQPEEDQVSTSTASEGEDVLDDHLGDGVLPTAPPAVQPELLKTLPLPPPPPPHCPLSRQHVSAQLVASPADPLRPALTLPQLLATPPATPIQTLLSARTHGHLQPTVIARASATHASVIQAVSHVIQAGGPKHLAHLAPCPSSSTTTAASSVHLAPGHPPIGHITVHPVAHLGPHLGQHLPTLYPQPVAVTQAAMVSHIAHTFAHHHVNGHVSSGPPAAATVGKKQQQQQQQQQAVGVGAQMVAHHPQLVGQAVLNPVTMVTMPPFPVSTLKLA